MIDDHAAINLLSYSLQIGVLVGVSAGIPRLLRVFVPAVQHAFWRALLLACVLLPLLQPRHAAMALPHPGVPAAPAAAGGALWPFELVSAVDGRRARDWTGMVFGIVAAGALCRLAWVSVGFIRLRRRTAQGGDDATGAFEDVQRALRTRASIRWSCDVEQAVTFGLRRPVVLLPASLQGLEPRALRAVVAHELFHVQRRDWAWLIAEEIVRAVFWFHPAMWWLVSRVQLARETVVDELSILFTNARRTYLDTLLALADDSAFSSSSAFSHRRHLFHRVMLLSKEGDMSSIRVVAASLALALALAGGAWTGVRAFPLRQAGASAAPSAQNPPRDPLSPDTHHLRATEFYERATKNTALSPAAKMKALQNAIDAEDRALAINPEYVPALIYKNLALRTLATVTTDTDEQHRMIQEADALRDKALALRRAAGLPDPPFASNTPAPPVPASYQEAIARLHPLRIGGNMMAPVKVRDAQPQYPEEAKSAGIQGVVILEAIVNAEGKVEDARILKSVPQLDGAALEAVRQWEYMPTLLNGAPVPIVVTLTVNFTLR